MKMKHPDSKSKESIEVHASQIENMKARGYIEVKPTTKGAK